MQTILRIVFLIAPLLVAPTAFAQDKPNILYILVDNWGWGDISIQGGSIPTPRIDTLAQEGLRMTNFNVESQCVPTHPFRDSSSYIRFAVWYGTVGVYVARIVIRCRIQHGIIW